MCKLTRLRAHFLGDFRSDRLMGKDLALLDSTKVEPGLTFLSKADVTDWAILTTALSSNTEVMTTLPTVGVDNNVSTPILSVSSPLAGLDELTTKVSQPASSAGGIQHRALTSEAPVARQDVPINANDDNGSAIVDYIPTKYDFQASKADYPPNTSDPEVVHLTMIDETPPPDEYFAVQGAYNYILNVSQPADFTGGHIRIWDSPSKDHEYTVFGTTTTQNLVPLSLIPSTGLYFYPNFFLEGTEPSLVDDEITISLNVNWNWSGTLWTSHYRTVKATVTPRIDTFIINNVATFFGQVQNPNGNNPPLVGGPNSRKGYFAYAEFKAITSGSLFSAIPYFVHNIISGNDLLPPGYLEYDLPPPQQYLKHVFSPATASFPLLDLTNPINAPYYDVKIDRYANAMPNGTDPLDARKYRISASDMPGTKPANNNQAIGALYKELDYELRFKLWLVLSYVNASNEKSMYSLAYTTWYTHLKSDTYQFGSGMTRNLGIIIPDPFFVRSHAKPDKTTLPIVNGTWISAFA